MKGRIGLSGGARGGDDLIVVVSKTVRPFDPFVTVVLVAVAFLMISARLSRFNFEKSTNRAQTAGMARRTMANTTSTEIICIEIFWLRLRYGMGQCLGSGKIYLYLQISPAVKVSEIFRRARVLMNSKYIY